MKKRIIREQLNELSDIQKEKLREMWVPEEGDYYVVFLDNEKYYEGMIRDIRGFRSIENGIVIYRKDTIPLLDIGQIIAITHNILTVNDERNYELRVINGYGDNKWRCRLEGSANNTHYQAVYTPQSPQLECSENNLCDALWYFLLKLL
jgi:hypothetical protein